MSEDDVSDEVIIKVTDYLEGTLPASERADIEAKIASDPAWKATHDEMVEARKMISGMQKARPPATFTEDVTATIHKRSAGRFFIVVVISFLRAGCSLQHRVATCAGKQ